MQNEPVVTSMVKHWYVGSVIEMLRKSFRIFNQHIGVTDCDGDDFIHNITTIVLEFDAYKMPRIVKNLLYKPRRLRRRLTKQTQ